VTCRARAANRESAKECTTIAAGGLISATLFRQAWRLAAKEKNVPQPTQRDRAWREILIAAAGEGVVYGITHAVLERATARSFERATGTWPGD